MSLKKTTSKKPEPDPWVRNDVIMNGEFVTGSRKVRCSLILTETALTVQKISPTFDGRGKAVYHLRDCVGCRAYRSHDSTDLGAYFSAFFYPLRKTRWMRSGVARHRVEQCFLVAPEKDPNMNLQEAQRWSRAIRERVLLHQTQRNPGSFFLSCIDIRGLWYLLNKVLINKTTNRTSNNMPDLIKSHGLNDVVFSF